MLNSVFGLPGFRGAQEEIVRRVTDGGNCLVLMPTGADIEAILQHAHWLGAVIDVSNERNVNNLMPAQGSHPLERDCFELNRCGRLAHLAPLAGRGRIAKQSG